MINFIVWLIMGGLIGWIASMMTSTRQGALLNIIVGIVGAFLSGLLLTPLFGIGTINQNNFSLASLLVSMIGAIILQIIVNLFRPKTTHTQEINKSYERTAGRELSSPSRTQDLPKHQDMVSNSSVSQNPPKKQAINLPDDKTSIEGKSATAIGNPIPVPLPAVSSHEVMMAHDYLDFEIDIGSPTGSEYPVTLLHSPAGEARTTIQWHISELALENRLKDLQIALLSSGGTRRTILSSSEQAVQKFGAELFNIFFSGELRNRYDVSQERAHQQGKGLRLKLRIQHPTLANLPWEFLHDSRTGEYICLSRQTLLVRYLELPQTIRTLQVTSPIRILAMIASPTDMQPLDVQVERQRLERAVTPLQRKGLVELIWLEQQTWRDLQRVMRREPWHVFHFIGHGDFDPNHDEGLIALCNEAGKAHLLTASDFGRLLTDNRNLRLVILNACLGAQGSNSDLFSSTAATLVRQGIPAVVAMQQAITDSAAIEFSRNFYESLADGLPVDAAINEARKAIRISIANSLEWGTPVLYSRSPDGRLFSVG